MTFNSIRPRDRVRFLIPAGIGRNGPEFKEKSGSAVLCYSDRVIVNGGGRHGTPYVVDERNYVGHSSPKK